MTAIQVAKLSLSCSPKHRDRTRFAIEDGLRTSIPDDRRLVLLRKMRVTGQMSALRPVERNCAVRDGWLAAIAGARHGGEDGAAGANCVWFASREEAERLLISRLLAGHAVDAWYWKLALPDWRGLPLRTWVPQILSEAISRGEDRRVLEIARCFVATGATQELVDLLARETPQTTVAGGSSVAERPGLGRSDREQQSAEHAGTAAETFVATMPHELRQAIGRMVRIGSEAQSLVLSMIRACLLRQSPALSLSPQLLAELPPKVVKALVGPKPLSPRPCVTDVQGRKSRRDRAAQPPEGLPPTRRDKWAPLDRDAPSPAPESAAVEESQQSVLDAEPSVPEVVSVPGRRLYSAHAGLWLVIPSLIELGFREWLAERPSLLGESPASRLLHGIARHHRIREDDPSLVVLGPLAEPHSCPEWTRLWRHGLDRWLRRNVRRRLHDLVNRQGELSFDDLKLVVHYSATDADIALRRRALDRDPGWTDWIGLSIRYNFGGTEDWL